MKKLFVLLLVVLVVGSIALAAVACGEDEETSTTAEADSSALPYSEAKNNVGATDLWFTGPVLKITDKGSKYLVVVGDSEDDVLNLAVTYEDAELSVARMPLISWSARRSKQPAWSNRCSTNLSSRSSSRMRPNSR